MARITIIDDDLELAQDMSQILKEAGHLVSVRGDIDGALEELAANRPDLLILDVIFPENPAGGFDLARQIRRTPALRDLPVILLTSINQEFPMDFSARDIDEDWLPVQDFLEKPAAPAALLAAIDKLLPA
jgi:twitching motility two-component system response regulator PilH